jgi:hypothetical protein
MRLSELIGSTNKGKSKSRMRMSELNKSIKSKAQR